MVRNRIGPGLVVVTGLGDQTPGQQRPHHAVDVHPADRGDPGPRDRLLVRDHGQRLQRRLGQLGLLAVQHVRDDQVGVLLAGVVAPAAAELAQLEPAAGLVVEGDQLEQGVGDHRRRYAQRRGQLRLACIGSSAISSSASSAPDVLDLAVSVVVASRPASSTARSLSVSLCRLLAGVSARLVVLGADRSRVPSRRRRTRRRSPGRRRRAGPADGQLAERGQLLEGDRALAEQLQQGQEARHRGDPVRRRRPPAPGTSSSRPGEAGRRPAPPAPGRSRSGACRWASEITSACSGASALAASAANSVRGDGEA